MREVWWKQLVEKSKTELEERALSHASAMELEAGKDSEQREFRISRVGLGLLHFPLALAPLSCLTTDRSQNDGMRLHTFDCLRSVLIVHRNVRDDPPARHKETLTDLQVLYSYFVKCFVRKAQHHDVRDDGIGLTIFCTGTLPSLSRPY